MSRSSWNKWLEKNQPTPEVKATMYQEWGYLVNISGMFLSLEPRMIFFSFALTTTYIAIVVVHMVLFGFTMFVPTNMVTLSQWLNYFSLEIISLGIFFGALSNRGSIIQLLAIMSNDFYDYGTTFDNKEVFEWKKSLRRFKIIIVVCIPVYLTLIAATVMFREYIDMLFGYLPTGEDYIGQLYQKTPVKMAYPFIISNDFTWAVVTLSQMANAAIIALTVSSGDVMMLFLGQTVALQMRILCTAAIKLDERAVNMYRNETRGKEIPKDPLDRAKDEILSECYRRAIKQIIEHHHIIQDFYRNYNELGKWPTFLAVLNGSILIAMSIAVVISGSQDVPSTMITAGLLLIGEVMSIWLLCETGQHVSEWSERLSNAMYDFSWIDISTANKKMVMIFQETSKKPLFLMAGGLTPINRDTFGTIMNSTYTYVNLLRASKLADSESK